MKALALAAAFTAPLGGSILDLEVAPDGAAWTIGYDLERPRTVRVPEQPEALPIPVRPRAVRVAPEGAVTITPIEHGAVAATIGSDGQPWFMDVAGGLERVDAAGRRTQIRSSGVSDERLTFDVVARTDGSAWTTTDGAKLVRLVPGPFSVTALALPRCTGAFRSAALVRASDGAIWVDDDLDCDRLIRVAPTGEAAVIPVPPDAVVTGLAPDTAGGVWFSALGPVGGHVTAAGEVTLRPKDRKPGSERWAVAQAPDGRPWFATRTCELLRLNGAGVVERLPSPIPARELAFAPSGRLWLASATRVVDASAPAAGCDDRPPTVRVSTGASLRRGVRIGVDEAAALDVSLSYTPTGDASGYRSGPERRRTIRGAKGGSVRLRIPRAWRVKRGEEVTLSITAGDRDGNRASDLQRLKVRR